MKKLIMMLALFATIGLAACAICTGRLEDCRKMYGNMVNPSFKQIWAPIDGRVINLSARINF